MMPKGFIQGVLSLSFFSMLATSSISAQKTNEKTFIDIDNHYLYLTCEGEGSPTVILESGFRNDSDVWTVSYLGKKAIFPAVARFTRVCAYDRPGTVGWEANKHSRSDALPMPRTAKAVVNDLHALLQKANEPGPYVMVGHSLGGLFVRLYASTYPKEVVGVVLVDALSDQMRNLLGKHWKAYKSVVLQAPSQLKAYKDLESFDLDEVATTMQKAQKTSPLLPMPFTVIAHGKAFDIPSSPGLSKDTLERAWQMSPKKLVELVPNGKLIVAKESEHYVQFFQPDVIIDAIHDTVYAVRAQKKT